jgi:tetratricopeptide (TPR) repeat protein
MEEAIAAEAVATEEAVQKLNIANQSVEEPLPLTPVLDSDSPSVHQNTLFDQAKQVSPQWGPAPSLADPPSLSDSEVGPKDRDAASAKPLLEMARKVAPAVVSLRSWDAHGNELARGCGAFIGDGGVILTDMAVVHPNFAERIEYVSVATGSGKVYRIEGYWTLDPATGLTVLQSDARDVPFVLMQPAVNLSQEKEVSIVALHEEHGLTLADAILKTDESAVGSGWLTLRGDDSPGEPGSPVFDIEGKIVAIVSMRVPQGKWFNFGVRVDAVAKVLEKVKGERPARLADIASVRFPPVQQDQRFIDAFRALSEGSTKRATSQLVKLLKPYPRSAELWALLGLCFSKLGAKEEALSCNRRAVALDPTIGQAWLQLAVNQVGPVADPGAREALEIAVMESPADRVSWMLLAEQQILDKQFVPAERSLVEVLKIEPDYPPASYLLGYAKVQQKDYAAAQAALERCVQLDRKHVQGWFYLGLLHAKRGRYTDAISAYRRVVEIQPEHPNAWRNLALMYRRLGHEADAMNAFQRHQRLPRVK